MCILLFLIESETRNETVEYLFKELKYEGQNQ